MKETDPRDVRFGYVAVKKEFVTSRQVIDALERQFIEGLELGKHRLLGEILVDEGHMIQSQVNEVLEELGEKGP